MPPTVGGPPRSFADRDGHGEPRSPADLEDAGQQGAAVASACPAATAEL